MLLRLLLLLLDWLSSWFTLDLVQIHKGTLIRLYRKATQQELCIVVVVVISIVVVCEKRKRKVESMNLSLGLDTYVPCSSNIHRYSIKTTTKSHFDCFVGNLVLFLDAFVILWQSNEFLGHVNAKIITSYRTNWAVIERLWWMLGGDSSLKT